jgi:hypothetical protein
MEWKEAEERRSTTKGGRELEQKQKQCKAKQGRNLGQSRHIYIYGHGSMIELKVSDWPMAVDMDVFVCFLTFSCFHSQVPPLFSPSLFSISS